MKVITPKQVSIPADILEYLVELSSMAEMDSTQGDRLTNPRLLEFSGEVFRTLHWYGSPGCRQNHPSWNPEVHDET